MFEAETSGTPVDGPTTPVGVLSDEIPVVGPVTPTVELGAEESDDKIALVTGETAVPTLEVTPPTTLLNPVPIDPKMPDPLVESEAGAVVAADPEYDTPDDETVGTDTGEAFVSEELPTKVPEPVNTPLGPNVIPPEDEAAEAVGEL